MGAVSEEPSKVIRCLFIGCQNTVTVPITADEVVYCPEHEKLRAEEERKVKFLFSGGRRSGLTLLSTYQKKWLDAILSGKPKPPVIDVQTSKGSEDVRPR